MHRILPFFIVLIAVSCSPSSSQDQTETEVRPAPDFTYTSLANEEYTLSELQGNVVYLFFFGSNCPHCRNNGPVTQSQIYEAFMNEEDFIALGLDTWNTNSSAVSSFQETTGIEYPLLLNARQSLVDYYGNTTSYDRSVVIAKNGHIVYQGTQFVHKDADEVVRVIEEELAKN
ncbi:MAG: redoxin domain-containing protein [Balneolaceae bacterium]|nr:redoxin domain-containing protein [Balneolaceae bacterium]